MPNGVLCSETGKPTCSFRKASERRAFAAGEQANWSSSVGNKLEDLCKSLCKRKCRRTMWPGLRKGGRGRTDRNERWGWREAGQGQTKKSLECGLPSVLSRAH